MVKIEAIIRHFKIEDVKNALIERGVPAAQVSAKGFGARHAIADNATEAGRARNRRIEFHTVSAK